MKRIIVNSGEHETRVAIMEDKKMIDFFIEPSIKQEQAVAGSIFKARVANVLPGMQAAFVDYGHEKNGFLYVGDCLPVERVRDKNKKTNIREVVNQGQELLVQIKKESVGTKGAKVTAQLSFPGRFLVYMPDDPYVGLSTKIENKDERKRLRSIASSLREEREGVIIRTVAQGASEEEIEADFNQLKNMWSKMKVDANQLKVPGVLHQDLSLVSRMARDMLTGEVDEFIIDDVITYRRVQEQMIHTMPDAVHKLKWYRDTQNIFSFYEVEVEIEKVLRRKVWLKSGGYLVIDRTEALTSIDVNTGKFIGKQDLGETVFQTNQEAAEEIIRQLRLRDIGGMILVDFIIMHEQAHRDFIIDQLKTQARREQTRVEVFGFTQLGLLEMTRRKVYQSLEEILMKSCSECQGRGRVLSEKTIVAKLEREIGEYTAKSTVEAFIIELHPHLSVLLTEGKGNYLSGMEKRTGIELFVKEDPAVSSEDYRIVYMGSSVEARKRLNK